MDRSEVEMGVTEIVGKLSGFPADRTIPLEADFKMDLGADSLFEAELGMEIEDRFEIEVPDGVRPRNIREVTDLILAAQMAQATSNAGRN